MARRRRLVAVLAAGLAVVGPGTALGARGSGSTTIQTLPPIPGAVFELPNGTRLTAGADGKVQVPTLLLGAFRGHAGPSGIRPVRTVHFRDGGYAIADGWWGTNGGRRPMTLGFKVFRPFTLKFIRTVSATGQGKALVTKAVSPDIIDRVSIKGSTGGLIQITHGAGKTLNVGRPHLYQTEHVVSRQGGPYVSPIQYRLKFVYISGTNVVHSLKESFYVGYDDKTLEPKPSRTVGYFGLIFYQARFTTKDMLLPHSIGAGVVLTFPDGTKREYAFTKPGEVTIPALPRGKYTVAVDAPGFGFSRPLTLTRDQDVQLNVISYIDIAIFAVVFLGIVIGLFVFRRPHLLGLRRKRTT